MSQTVFFHAVSLGIVLSLTPCRAGEAAASDAQREVQAVAVEFLNLFRIDNPTPAARLTEILADDCVKIAADNAIIKGKEAAADDAKEWIGRIRDGFKSFEPKLDPQWVRVDDNMAIIFGKMTCEGQPKEGDAPLRVTFCKTMVFRKTGGKWLLVLHQDTAPQLKAAGTNP